MAPLSQRRAAESRSARRPTAGRCLVAVLALWAASARAEDEEEEEESKSSDILEVMAWCKDINDNLDWGQVLRLAKVECQYDADDDEALRIRCSPEGLTSVAELARIVLEVSAERSFACANGVIFLMAVVLAYVRESFLPHELLRAQVLLWQALQENFMVDASVWPVKTFDVLRLFDMSPAIFDFAPFEYTDLSDITFIVPRCPAKLAKEIWKKFPEVRVVAGVVDEVRDVPETFVFFDDAWERPSGQVMNRMLEAVTTPLVFVVLAAALPPGPAELERLVHVLQQRRVVAAAGPIVTEDRVYSDFCYRLSLRHYQIGFDSVYKHSLIFDEASAASIRGSWFTEDQQDAKDGPCKLCETLPPTFLARTDVLRAISFNPMLDGEWALLDFGIRATRLPSVEVRPRSSDAEAPPVGGKSWLPGKRHAGAFFALCPFSPSHELEHLGAGHLYGRRDVPATGVALSASWFGDDAAALGPVSGGRPGVRHLRPSQQAQFFMEANSIRVFTGPEGVERRFGCTLAGTNCPVPNWVYRGWAVPPCCKETMRHLLFYIDDVFKELGIRYIITDGVLLGSYKYGEMLDWDADVDLHIHYEDFPRLFEEDVQSRVKQDGHFLRLHANNDSWLLQANDHNYLLIELNKRKEFWDPDLVWQLPVQGRLFPAMENSHVNLSTWYGMSFFRHRLRHVPEWEEEHRPMFCATPYHFNCVDETQVYSGNDCQAVGIC